MVPKRARQLNLREFVEHLEDEEHYINAKYLHHLEEEGKRWVPGRRPEDTERWHGRGEH